MTSTLSRFVFALGLAGLIGGMPVVAGAQEKTESSDQSGGEASETTTDQSEGGDSDQDANKASEDQDEDGESTSEDKAAKNDDKGDEKEKAQTGPGGKKLNTDYPANDKAKQEKMETERIEGLQFEEDEDPSDAYNLEIQELETKIDDLKERVFQSKSRVVLLKETVLGGNLSGSRAVIVHNGQLGGRFKLQRAMYSLDGNRVFNESKKTGKLPEKKTFKVYDDSLTTGQHNLSILLEYRGSGFGIFSYMKGYEFKITSSCQFTAKAGKLATLKVKSVSKAGALKDVQKQPGIQCELSHTDLSEADVETSSSDQDKGNNKGSAANSGGGNSSSGESGG